MTSPSPAIADTSFLSALARIGRLELLRLRFSVVQIPEAVWDELRAGDDPQVIASIEAACREGWMKRVAPSEIEAIWQPPAGRLGAGESAVLALAMTQPGALVLMDEKRGRRAARLLGITTTGVLGLLSWAKTNGHLPSFADAIRDLRTKDRFFLPEDTLRQLLEEAGESVDDVS